MLLTRRFRRHLSEIWRGREHLDILNAWLCQRVDAEGSICMQM